MVWFLGGTAVLCLLYYIIIVIYSGVSTSFALIWPCLAIFLGLLAAGWWFGSQHEGRIPVWVGVSVGTVWATGFLILVITEVLIGWSSITATGQPADYVIVLGARVRGTKLSNSLKQRLDRAIEYSEEYPNTVLVLSGGKGPGEEISEARAMYEYLQYNGIPEDKLLIEDQSSDTVQNIEFSRTVIDRQEYNKAQAARAHLMEFYRERPDGDTIGSASALCLGLRQLGKTAFVLTNEQFTPRFAPFLDERAGRCGSCVRPGAGGAPVAAGGICRTKRQIYGKTVKKEEKKMRFNVTGHVCVNSNDSTDVCMRCGIVSEKGKAA